MFAAIYGILFSADISSVFQDKSYSLQAEDVYFIEVIFMKVLFIGDVVGENGQDMLAKALPQLKAQHKPDVTIVNGENSHKSGKPQKTPQTR